MSGEFSTAKAYETLFHLARGGMGRVVLVAQRRGAFERIYAMKTLHPYLLEDDSFRRMFVEEARLAGLIQHPNVVGVVDVGEGDDGPFLILEYVEGLALSVIMGSLPKGDLLPIEVCLRFALDAARGLAAAHGATSLSGEALSLVHRDVSPQNLLVGYDGVLRVTDFGVAKALDADNHTATGVLKGKVGYMAPEQLMLRRADYRCDLYSLGVVLFETLSGERLYPGGADSGAAERVLNEPVPDIEEFRSDVPPELSALLFDLLAKDPAHRPPSMDDVARRLAELLEGYSGHDELVPAFMDARFGDQRAEMRARIRAALDEGEASGPIDPMAPTIIEEAPQSAPEAPTRNRGMLGAFAFIGVVALGAAFFAGTATRPDETAVPPVVADEAPSPEPVAQEPPPELSAMALEEAPETNVEGAMTPEAAEMRRRPRMRRSPRRTSTMSEMDAVNSERSPDMLPPGWWPTE